MQRVAATANVPASAMSVPGYTLVRRIAVGGQAIVYEAVQNSLERRVALKVLNPLHAENEEFTRRFLNEGRILANLGHSNVITIHDIGVANGLHFLSMELVEGGDLNRRIRAGLDPRTVIDYLLVIADCLGCAHERNVVHRDIKPANVLFRTDGTLLLTDFGIAKLLDTEDLTVTGTTMGSPSYLSPEQARNGEVDGRSDIYSLGAMAFEMFTGQRPYSAGCDFDTVQKHLTEPVPQLPAALERYQSIIDRMMAKSPSERFVSARALMEALRPLRAGVQVLALPAAPFEQQLPGDEEVDRDAITLVPLPDAEPARVEPAAGRDDEVKVVNRGPVPVGRLRRSSIALAVAGLLGVAAVFMWQRDHEAAAPDVAQPMVSPPRAVGPPAAAAESAAQEAADVGAAAEERPISGESPVDAHVSVARQAADVVAATERLMPGDSPANAEIAALLAAGRAALDDLRLTRPEGDNALDYYTQVLVLEPGNAKALAGRRNIARRYATLARGSIARGDRARARALVMRGLAVHGGDSDLLALRDAFEASPPATAPADAVPRATSPVDPLPADPASADKSPPEEGRAADAGGIQGETPRELFQRVRSWFD